MSDIGVEVDIRSIGKAMRDAVSDFWIHFRTEDCSRHDLGQALNTANDPDGTFGEGPWQTPTGFAIRVRPGGSDNFDAWVLQLVAYLEDLGATGRLEGVEPAGFRGNWPTDDPTPAAFLAWPEDLDAATADEYRTSHWHVPPDATAQIVEHAAAWTATGGEQAIVHLGSFPLAVSPDSDVVSMMHSSLINNGNTASIRFQSIQQRGRMATLRPGGAATMQEVGASVPWQQRVDAVHEALTTGPTQYLDLAFIRSSPSYTRAWTQIDIRQKRDPRQKLPDLHERNVRYNRHLLSRYTPDAHGIQILTDQHLGRARDLSSWNIREVGHGRFLVEAEDLTAWYSTPLPDQEVVDRARHDFGDMILTKETIAANPPPWRPAA